MKKGCNTDRGEPKFVKFDKHTRGGVRCSDPALAVYLLQQSVEKAVKALAVASGKYDIKRDFSTRYRHNSLELILNLYERMTGQLTTLGLDPMFGMMGINVTTELLKLKDVQAKAGGRVKLAPDKEETLIQESRRITPEVLGQLIDMMLLIRSGILNAIDVAFEELGRMSVNESGKTPEVIVSELSQKVSSRMNIQSLTATQQQATFEFLKVSGKLGLKPKDQIKEVETKQNYLDVWATSVSLYLLAYITFGHESTARYPRYTTDENSNNGKSLGYQDYTDNLAVVNQIGRLGYIVGLTLQHMKNEIELIEFVFALSPKLSGLSAR